jgi:hypothetical protein
MFSLISQGRDQLRRREPECSFCDHAEGPVVAGPGVTICARCIDWCIHAIWGHEDATSLRAATSPVRR